MTDAPKPGALALAEGFPRRRHADWVQLARAVVNKSRAEDRQLSADQAEDVLRTHLAGDLTIDPLYTRPEHPRPLGFPAAMPFTRGRVAPDRDRPWDVRALHEHPDPAVTAAAIADDVAHGVTSLWLTVGADGLAAADLAPALAGLDLATVPLAVSSADDQAAAAAALLAVLDAAGSVAPGGSLGHDPVGLVARRGGTPDLSPLAPAVRACGRHPGTRAVTVDATVYHDAGASVVDEIALAVATGVAYLRALDDEGLSPSDAVRYLEFRMSASADQFLTTAALRALRRVWARVCEASGVPEAGRGAVTHAVTSWRMLTREDPWVNVLRATLACFGAAAGAADAITVLPYDTVAGLPERFSRRLARNTSVVLAAESHVGAVADPAGGAWYVESLTDDLASRAWVAFQELEHGGGIVAALAAGTVADLIAETSAERAEALAERTQPVTGVSMFPVTDQTALERTPRAELPPAPEGLAPHRDAEVFEALRDRSAAYTAAHGHRPTVVLAALGARRDFGTRQSFVTNLLAAGGVDAAVVESGDPAEVAAAARVAQTPYVILASSPKGYVAHAAAMVTGLREAEVDRVLVAGRARELGKGAPPTDGEVRVGTDVVAFLGTVLDTLGAPKGATR